MDSGNETVNALRKIIENAGYHVVDKNREGVAEVMKTLKAIDERIARIEKKLAEQ